MVREDRALRSRRLTTRFGSIAVKRGWGDEDVRVFSNAGLLLRAVRSGKVEIILASSLNGLARSSLELVELLREFVSRKITLIVPGRASTLPRCPGSVSGRARCNRGVQAAAATESIREGLVAARKRGVRLGRPQTVNAHRGDVARLRAQGMTGRAIAKELGIPSSNVFKLIKGTSLKVAVCGR